MAASRRCTRALGTSAAGSCEQRRQHDIAIGNLTHFAALQENRSRQSLVAVERTARDPRDFLGIDQGRSMNTTVTRRPISVMSKACQMPGARGAGTLGAIKP